jgi:hypothetical protein
MSRGWFKKAFPVFLLLLVAGVLLVLHRWDRRQWPFNAPRVSGIAETLYGSAPLQSAGASQGAEVLLHRGGCGTAGFQQDSEAHFGVTLSSGTPTSLISAYRAEVSRQIEKAGGTIRGRSYGGVGPGEDYAFSRSYDWRGNTGKVIVRMFVAADGRVEITQCCFEHPR